MQNEILDRQLVCAKDVPNPMEQHSASSDEPPLPTESSEKLGPYSELTSSEIALLLRLNEIAAIKDHKQKKAERDKLLTCEESMRTIFAIKLCAEGIRTKLNGSLESNGPLRKMVDGIRMQAALEIVSRQTNFG